MRRAARENARGPAPKMEFLALPLIDRLGKSGRITRSSTKLLQSKPSEQMAVQKCADFQRGTMRVPGDGITDLHITDDLDC